ncbi:MAG TPA: selenide, water dikinase SelD [Bacteroidales bacterium]|nr:selenide, water dikinase SelD [Bacteroidales bacterium]
MMEIDLLNLVEQGGCSAKLSAAELKEALADLPVIKHENILVDIETHDDAGVFKIRDDYALIQTTDFFPPVCSEAYDFGQIAAANALSDVYAMGGQVLSALNIMLFPADLPMTILKEILRGGQDKVQESGGFILGGHTITNEIPTYGLAVTGWIHPDKVVTNDQAEAGDVLILSKPIGTGIIISAKKNNLVSIEAYEAAKNNMKHLNDKGAEVMNQFGIKAATDVTGFGIMGHAMKMADGSKVSIRINSKAIPTLPSVMDLIEMGCIPGAAFRNQEFTDADCEFEDAVDYNHKMLVLDAQTSGGLLMAVKPKDAEAVVEQLKKSGYPNSAIVGEVIPRRNKSVYVY